jgi:hypothetical protein
MTLFGSFIFSDRSPVKSCLAVPRRFLTLQARPASRLAGPSRLTRLKALEGHR